MPVIGIRTVGRKWFYRAYIGGKMRMCCFTEVISHTLHSTKGWKLRDRSVHNLDEGRWRDLPPREETFDWRPGFPSGGVGSTIEDRSSSVQKLQRRKLQREPDLRAQMRHRERRRDIAQAAHRAAMKAAWDG